MLTTEAEQSVVTRMLREQNVIGQVATSTLTGDDFADGAMKYIFNKLVENFYADDPTDAVSIATLSARYLAKVWGGAEHEAKERVLALAASEPPGRTEDHVGLVKEGSNARRLFAVVQAAHADLRGGELPAEAVAGRLAQDAAMIATGGLTAGGAISFADAGRNFLAEVERDRKAKAAGLDLGAKFGIGAVDGWTHGLLPTELLLSASEPGVGKSTLWWRAALNFADRQMSRPANRRIGTLVLSLEMGEKPSSHRVATMLSGVPTSKMREGTLTDAELKKIVDDWRRREEYPLWFDYSSYIRASALRALVAEHVRRHNVGLVVIDHFRMFNMDRPPRTVLEHEEEKITFLKQQIAKDMNLAVVCLAHTRKIEDERGRPRPSDLRGSDQMRAMADFVPFLWRPEMYATEHELDVGIVEKNKAFLVWAKNRHGITADSELFLDLERMSAY